MEEMYIYLSAYLPACLHVCMQVSVRMFPILLLLSMQVSRIQYPHTCKRSTTMIETSAYASSSLLSLSFFHTHIHSLPLACSLQVQHFRLRFFATILYLHRCLCDFIALLCLCHCHKNYSIKSLNRCTENKQMKQI